MNNPTHPWPSAIPSLEKRGAIDQKDIPPSILKRGGIKGGEFRFGATILLFFLFVCFLAPLVYPYDPNQTDLNNLLAGPSLQHLLGTDDLGRDILARILVGGRVSLTIGFTAVLIAILLGTIIGAVSGYLGGKFDSWIMKLVDFFLSLPIIFILLALQSVLKPNLFNVMAVIGLTSWMGTARLVRAEFLRIKNFTYIKTARAYGLSQINIIFKKILPNAIGPLVVAATLGMAGAILTESTLSYLGLGLQPPHASWGNMLQTGQEYMVSAPWVVLAPGLCIFLNVLSLNFIGEGLRNIFDK